MEGIAKSAEMPYAEIAHSQQHHAASVARRPGNKHLLHPCKQR